MCRARTYRRAAGEAHFIRRHIDDRRRATTLQFARRVAVDAITSPSSPTLSASPWCWPPIHPMKNPDAARQMMAERGSSMGRDDDALQRFRASKAFLGASGITAEGPNDAGVGPGSFTCHDAPVVETIIWSIHTKFDRPSLIRLWRMVGKYDANF